MTVGAHLLTFALFNMMISNWRKSVSIHKEQFIFQNNKTTYTITYICLQLCDPLLVFSLLQTDCLDFTVDKSVFASPGFQAGSETSVEVCFEPHQLGEVRGQLKLSSCIGGEYIFPLIGICLPPKAQGPFSIRAGRNVIISFKNVFLQTTAFSFQVKNQRFESL